MKKKILYVITKSNWGGAQRYVFDLATHLPTDEFDAAVAFGKAGMLAEKLSAAQVRIHSLQSLQRDISLQADIQSFFELYRLFKKERPDVVHLNSSKVGGLGSLAARMAGVPKIIFTAHGWPFREKRPVIVVGILWCISWITSLLSTKVICVSNYDLTQARKMPFISKKAMRIYNGIDLNLSLGSGATIRDAFPPHVHITGTIGELTHNKNHLALIKEAKRTSDMHVAIVGEGELKNVLEQKIKEYGLEHRVKLFGFIPAAEVLRGFDTFVLPSLKEGLPYVLLEARAAGLPIVANRVGGVGEILDAHDMDEFSLQKMVAQTSALYR